MLEIPYVLSLMLHLDPEGEVKGLKDFPEETWPPIGIVRTAFQIMIVIGVIMMSLSVWGAWFVL